MSQAREGSMKKGLLFGAGFSYDFGMPLAKDVTDIFLTLFDWWQVKKLVFMLSTKEPFGKDRPINKKSIAACLNIILDYKKRYKSSDGNGNYEELIGIIENSKNSHNKNLSDRDSYHFILCILYSLIYKILELYQNKSYSLLYEKAFPVYSKFENLLSQEETWIATLNHDLYLECLAVDLKIPITYGELTSIFFPIDNRDLNYGIMLSCTERNNLKFKSKGFFHNKRGINVIKLHGGLSELEYKDRSLICNLDMKYTNSQAIVDDFNKIQKMAFYANNQPVPHGDKDMVVTNKDGELDIIAKAMMTGGKKYSKTSEPKNGEEKLVIFDNMLNEIEELTIIGYGFGDKHINNRLLNAMVRNNKLSVWIVSPNLNKIPEFLEQFDYNMRVRRASCDGPSWMNYVENNIWDVAQGELLKENQLIREEIKQAVLNSLKPSKKL